MLSNRVTARRIFLTVEVVRFKSCVGNAQHHRQLSRGALLDSHMWTEHCGLGLREADDRRARAERRARPRPGRDRRRSDRRRNMLVSLMATGMSLGWHAPSLQTIIQPHVEVSVVGFTPIYADRAYEGFVQEAASAFDLDPALIRAVIQAESAFDTWAVSRAGAQGLMQLMPALSQSFGVDDPFDPRQNILAGAEYLKQLLDRFDGNMELALAGYNAGPTVVARYSAIPPFKETRRYVKTIKALLSRNQAASTPTT
jgi:soluble lytic murein transglycosylase-like protein